MRSRPGPQCCNRSCALAARLRLVHQPLIQSISAVLPFRRHTPAAVAALTFSAMPKGMGCCRVLGLVAMRRG